MHAANINSQPPAIRRKFAGKTNSSRSRRCCEMPLSEENAIALYESEWWKTVSDLDIVKFQLFEDRLCMAAD
jgi:hypothetical protein